MLQVFFSVLSLSQFCAFNSERYFLHPTNSSFCSVVVFIIIIYESQNNNVQLYSLNLQLEKK